MSHQTNRDEKINRIVAIAMVLSLIGATSLHALVGSDTTFHLLFIAGPQIALMLYFSFTKKWNKYVPWLTMSAMNTTSFIMIASDPVYVYIMLYFLGLIFLGIFANTTLLILEYIVAIAQINYFYFAQSEEVYLGITGVHFASVNIIFTFCFAILLMLTRVWDKIYAESEQQKNATEEEREKLTRILEKNEENKQHVNEFSKKLAQETKDVNLQSLEFLSSVIQMKESIEEESNAIDHASGHIEEMVSEIEGIEKSAQQMKKGGLNTMKIIDSSKEQTDILTKSTAQLEQTFHKNMEVYGKLMDRLEKISTIIEIVKEVSGKTSLLSLNASIEAARAGEHGRGFSVVAEEVKKLAEKSTDSTKQMDDIIKEIKEIAHENDLQMRQLKENVRSNKESTEKVNLAFEHIAKNDTHIIHEIDYLYDMFSTLKENIQHINTDILTISSISKENVMSIDEISASFEKINKMIEDTSVNFTLLKEQLTH